MHQQYAVEVYGPTKPTWLGLPSDEDDGGAAPLTTDPLFVARYPNMTEASAACVTAASMWRALTFTASPIEPLYECAACGHTTVLSGLNACQDLHSRLDFPIGHPGCIEPAGDCPECGAFAYLKDAPEAEPTKVPAQQIHLPLRLQPCQDDHGDSTVIVDAKGFVVAVINSAVWNPDAVLENPQDRAYAALILQAVNAAGIPPATQATRHYSLSLTGMGLDHEEHDSDEARQDWFDKQRGDVDDHYYIDISASGELLESGIANVGERYDEDDEESNDEQR